MCYSAELWKSGVGTQHYLRAVAWAWFQMRHSEGLTKAFCRELGEDLAMTMTMIRAEARIRLKAKVEAPGGSDPLSSELSKILGVLMGIARIFSTNF